MMFVRNIASGFDLVDTRRMILNRFNQATIWSAKSYLDSNLDHLLLYQELISPLILIIGVQSPSEWFNIL